MPGNSLLCAPDIYGREPEIYCGSQERVAANSTEKAVNSCLKSFLYADECGQAPRKLN